MSDPTIYYKRLPEKPLTGRRLGRHIKHDPRSLDYRIHADGTIETARWERVVPVFDQLDLGSCTGNAAVGTIGTNPHYYTVARRYPNLVLDETEAVRMYSDATALDDYQGTYPPEDTGSDGLSVAKACQRAGLISGYTHITSLEAAYTAIQMGPFIVGSNWYQGFDRPDINAVVEPTGRNRGGHEYACVGYDKDDDLWEFVNSWGAEYGDEGRFYYTSETFSRLLNEDGDATVFVPLTEPAPQPDNSRIIEELEAAADEWLTTKHPRAKRLVAALKAWLASLT